VKLQLEGVQAPLPDFTLEVTATLTAAVTGIFGASGAGKTSLLDVIAGLRKPIAGSITLNDTIFSDGRKHLLPRRRGIGYVPQENALFPHFSVLKNVRYGVTRHDDQHERRILDILEIARLTDRSVASLSGGEQKRVALARALLSSPRLLLLDEPLAGVDHALRDRVATLLELIRDELRVPMLYVTHDPTELVRLAGETLVLERGKLVRVGATADVLGTEG
jgi:molybdate transport system ATP-binding protein